MAINKHATLEALKTAMNTSFTKALQNTPMLHDKVATTLPSSAKTETYAWLDQFPHMRKWVGDRVIQDANEDAYQVTNDKYESTLGIAREDIEDGTIGHYGLLAASQGKEAVKLANRLSYGQLNKGFTNACYDGQNFFDTDHPVNTATDGSGTDASVSNVITGSDTPWYLITDSEVIKPIIFQERTKPEMNNKTAANDSDHVFMKDEYLMGIRYRCAAGFGLWQTAVAGQVALTEDNFNDAFEMMESFKAHGGDPLGLTPTTLVVPPSLRKHAENIILTDTINNRTNVNYKRVEIVVSPWLS